MPKTASRRTHCRQPQKQRSREILLTCSKARSFPREIAAIKRGRLLPAANRLKALDPALIDGVLRVRRRARHGSYHSQKKPPYHFGWPPPSDTATGRILLPPNHPRETRERGQLATRSLLSGKLAPYRQTSSRPLSTECRMRRAQTHPTKMDDLPLARLESSHRPFTHYGMEYFGPTKIIIGRHRVDE